MERYKVLIYPAAKQDLSDVINYLNTLSPAAAQKYYDLIVSEISALSTMPNRFPRPKIPAIAARGYRFMQVKNYLVFYVVSGDTVQVRRILYAKSNYGDLL